MKSLVKRGAVRVRLTHQETAALKELARRERTIRNDAQVGAGTLLREYAMPRVHERLAELKAQDSLQPAGAV